MIGRGGRIRTGDPLRPRQVRYQAALRPDSEISKDSTPLVKGRLWHAEGFRLSRCVGRWLGVRLRVNALSQDAPLIDRSMLNPMNSTSAAIDQTSSSQAKIRRFRSLFRGWG